MMGRGINAELDAHTPTTDDGYVVSQNARIVGGTELAWRLHLRSVVKGVPLLPDTEIWVPKRAIHTDSEVFSPHGPYGKLTVEQWLAKQRGWLEGEDGTKTKGSRSWFGVPPQKKATP